MSSARTATPTNVPGARTPSAPVHDRQEKRRRVLGILDQAGAESLLLTSQTALAWYLDGSRVHVSLIGDPVAALLVNRDGDHLVTYNNEAERLSQEEIPAGVALFEVPWYSDLRDVPAWYGPGEERFLREDQVMQELRSARRSLLPAETARYELLATETAEALTDVLAAAVPSITEIQLAARLAESIVLLGAEPLVLLCSGASRSGFRHPLPTGAPLGRRAMVVVCARRDGMIINATRWMRFDAGTAAEHDAEQRIAEVEADLFSATAPGEYLSEILAHLKLSYRRHGFGPDQWTLHHQGGPAGYAGRDPRVTDASEDRVALNQAFTWNPSAPGVKIEDTVLLRSSGIDVLTRDPRWPIVLVNGIPRPRTLEL